MEAPVSSPAETGTVERFFQERGYGFIRLSTGQSVFFFIIELLKAGMESISFGTPVVIGRAIAKDGRVKVGRFLEINGAPVMSRNYLHLNKRWFLLGDLDNGSLQQARVENFLTEKLYGFAQLAGATIFFHSNQQCQIGRA